MSALWRIWLWNDPEVEQLVLDAGFISLSRDDIGNVPVDITDEELDRRIRSVRPHERDGAYGQFVRYWRSFLDMSAGDYVLIALSGFRATAARVLGPFEQQLDAPRPELRYVHRVELLLEDPRPKATLPRDLAKRRDLPATVISVDSPGALTEFLEWVEEREK